MFGKMQNAMFGSGKQSGPDMGMGPPGGGSPVMGGGGRGGAGGMALTADEVKEAFREFDLDKNCLLYTSPSPRDATLTRMPSSA